MRNKELYERIFLRTTIIVLTILFLVFLAPALINALMPIILALVLVGLLAPSIRKIDDILPIKHKAVSYLLGTVLLLLLLFFLLWFIQFIVNQVSGLVGNIISNWDKIVSSVNTWINDANSQINLMPDYVSNTIRSGLNSLYEWLGSLQKNAINITFGFTQAFINTSNDIIFFVITFVVAFYIILGDMQNVSNKYHLLIPEKSKNNLSLIRTVFKNSTWNYIKSQLKLALLCTIIMAIFLFFIGQQYFIPIALILGFVDLLPMIGPIIVLLPWSIIELLIFDNTFKALGLLIVLTAWTGLRQVISPKVIGSSADIHPILSVIALYAGLKLFGVMGAIFLPVIFIFIVGIYRSGIIDNWIYDYKEFFKYVSNTLNIGKRNIDISDDN
ncbi:MULTISPECIES: AI-2E family transporter [Anaerococcus]|uniref:AI-2E family transporter n=1 Tax=Anaerococcus TaxID=165779 RepID=UPI0023566132|nr:MULTISPECIES: AI-2E family transporter [Anaerococcus]MDU2599260.1 AI-2E family transporter [Anaerococcus sp.]MDU4025876.1 AI-2E family transporter [Anaerococcus sp.]